MPIAQGDDVFTFPLAAIAMFVSAPATANVVTEAQAKARPCRMNRARAVQKNRSSRRSTPVRMSSTLQSTIGRPPGGVQVRVC